MKTAIVYYSKHHGNTKKLLDEIEKEGDVTLIDASEVSETDLSGYELIGFASGIYFSKMNEKVLELAGKCLPENKKVFFIFTCGSMGKNYTKAIKDIAVSKGADILGEYGCRGFDTYGPFKLVGGIAKGHPDDKDISGAVEFFKGLCK
ncbi:flavodoxin family protein [Huintestinicola sp.]|uniref:flavodoxin family protein n=1 Tax=Huintestinicola sp. TaxID=2981661 RepID=UPI003D7E5622